MKTLLLTLLVLGLVAMLQAQDPLSFWPEQQNVRLVGWAAGKGSRQAVGTGQQGAVKSLF